MKIYVASSWRNAHQPNVVSVLRSAGHEVYDFRNPDPSDPTNDGFRWQEVDPEWESGEQVSADRWRRMVDQPKALKGFDLDFGAMKAADVVVFVLPCGRSASWECGWMMGAGKPAIVVALEPTEPELMFREARIVGNLADLLFALDDVAVMARLTA
jgi:hypothetical protein